MDDVTLATGILIERKAVIFNKKVFAGVSKDEEVLSGEGDGF